MSLKSTISELAAALADRATKRATLDKQKSGDGFRDAREAHLAADELVETLYGQLVPMLEASQAAGLTEFELLALEESDRANLRHALSERRRMDLLEALKPTRLPEMVEAWRQAAFTLDAAKALDSLRSSVGADELPQAIKAFDGRIRETNPEAWERAVATFEAIHAFFNRAGDSDVARATVENRMRWLRRYDALREQLQTMVERMSEDGSLSFELEELDVPSRKALVSAIDGGLIRKRQLAPQTQTRRQLEVLTETETETEFETKPEEDLR